MVILIPFQLLRAIGVRFGAIAGGLKARFGSHEVLPIMLNFIALALSLSCKCLSGSCNDSPPEISQRIFAKVRFLTGL
jgi:hypothetical protein